MLPLDLSATGIDFYAFTGHKWLCGPAGVGGLYVNPGALDFIDPTFIGWRGIQVDSQANPIGWLPDARRFEVATSDGGLWAGLNVAIATHNQYGTAQARYERICQLSRYLWEQLHALPEIHCLRPEPPESGLVSFQIWRQGEPAPAMHNQLVQALENQKIHVRTLLSPHCVRACTHYFSLESEIDALIEQIQQFLKAN
jgi:L-cysteine/cystine lyase